MAFTLDNVVPWGRSMHEYKAMFVLYSQDLDSSILGCADGPASFNAEMSEQGHSVPEGAALEIANKGLRGFVRLGVVD